MANNHDRLKPAEVARETIKQLALRRMTPTPENYSDLYGEISGEPDESQSPQCEPVAILARQHRKAPLRPVGRLDHGEEAERHDHKGGGK